ncbi:putative mitogen-activated protein kinase kinase kinase 7-like isoform X1 [Drosophila sulfurigaster albostrigata]|uniref:putative mitogen-activated protein kinase kinase kinase 7-like isoform X1 n=1 Tax=Drosophila sulfurigaster albostrigata TaxID=89887 RepID=UPI002D218409|nr:putative mitogen-activated protein kinase kinase kinase 7-like isoform X1 [Drosophila sulfurigaster albostrigata]
MHITLIKRIGSGSYGVVYEGIWITNARKCVKVAVKCLEKGNNEDSETNIFREIRNLQELNHENIVTFHDAYRQKNICLIFEYSDCGSLYDYLQKKIVRVSNIEKLHWMLQWANGMEYLHSKKTIHRDLKPQNLLLFNNYRTLKICDFGTVKQYATENTELIGTIGYMAPEVCTADGKYTEKCDVFSYGITFWEVFAENKPFDELKKKNMHPLAIQNKIINGARPDINDMQICKDSDLIKTIIEKCWDRNPECRPTMKGLIAFLAIDLRLYTPINFEDIDITEYFMNGRYGLCCKAYWRSGFSDKKVDVIFFQPDKPMEMDFLKEVYKLKELIHQNIVTLYGVSRQFENSIFLLFECSTVSIHNLFHDQKCTNTDSYFKIEWIYQCLHGLDYLHNNNIVHGVLTTENLLLFDDCRNVKIFVIGKVDHIYLNAIANKEESVYVAPEVYDAPVYEGHSEEREFTKESDIYSFGIIMWEIVTAKNPVVEFKNKQPSTIMKIINDTIHTRTSDIRKIRNAIEDCLKTAEYRPDTKELIRMLIS